MKHRGAVISEDYFFFLLPIHDPDGDPEATFLLQQGSVSLFLDPRLQKLGNDHGSSRLEGINIFRQRTSPPGAAVAEEAVVGLGVDAPRPHFLHQAMGRGEYERLSPAEELYRASRLAGAPTTIEVAARVPSKVVNFQVLEFSITKEQNN